MPCEYFENCKMGNSRILGTQFAQKKNNEKLKNMNDLISESNQVLVGLSNGNHINVFIVGYRGITSAVPLQLLHKK